jgi:ACS family pantothenate transporter-like MFS transporter
MCRYVSGMAEEIGFTGIDYNITQTIFQGERIRPNALKSADSSSVGYIVGGIPQSLIVSSNRIRLSIWL